MEVQHLEADLDIFGLEKTVKQGISCGNEHWWMAFALT